MNRVRGAGEEQLPDEGGTMRQVGVDITRQSDKCRGVSVMKQRNTGRRRSGRCVVTPNTADRLLIFVYKLVEFDRPCPLTRCFSNIYVHRN